MPRGKWTLRERPKWEHGTIGGYTNHKCRCEACRLAKTLTHRIYRERDRLRFQTSPEQFDGHHGRGKTYQAGCRCELCRSAHSKYNMGRNRGVTYDQMVERHGEICGICGRSPSFPSTGKSSTGGRLVIDHDHTTGQLRGLLCNGCNTALGKFQDSISGLERAIDYLRRAEAASDA